MDRQDRRRFGQYWLLLFALAVLVFLLATGPPSPLALLLGLALVIGGLALSVPLTRVCFRSLLEEQLKKHGTLDELERWTREHLKSQGMPAEYLREWRADALSWRDFVPTILPAVLGAVLLSMATWVAVHRLVARLWPGAPHWMPVSITLALLVLLGAVVWLRHSHRLEGQSLTRKVRAIPLLVLSFSGFILGVVLGALFLLFVAIAPAAMGRDLRVLFLMYGPLGRGNYERALRRLRLLSRWKPKTPGLLGLRGGVLAMAGRPAEAEVCLRECIEKHRDSPRAVQVLDLSALGEVLIDQGRHEEARLCLGRAILLDAGTGSPYQNMAELCLRQGIEPEKALRLIDLAMADARPVPMECLRRYSASEMWADKAWALALLGRHSEAEEAIQRALKEADPKFLPVLAGVNWRLGMALIAMGRSSPGLDHFRHACDIDPSGKYGSLAARALTEHCLPANPATGPDSGPPSTPV